MSGLSNQDFRRFVAPNQPKAAAPVDTKGPADVGLTFSRLSTNQKLNSMRQEIRTVENVKKSRKGSAKQKYVPKGVIAYFRH